MELGHILMTGVNAIMPIVLLILLGYLLRKTGFLTPEFLKVGNKLVFHICLPCLLFLSAYDIGGLSNVPWMLIIFTCGVLLVLYVLGILLGKITTKDPTKLSVLVQSAFRGNTAIIGLPLAAALGGEEVVATTAILAAMAVPLVNILAVICFSVYTGEAGKKKSLKSVFVGIVRNPLVIAIFLAVLCLAVRELQQLLFGRTVFLLSRDLKFVYQLLVHLKSIASPLALIVLGGEFVFETVRSLWKEIIVGTMARIVLSPLLGVGLAILLDATGIFAFSESAYPALLSIFSAPAAVSGAVMAKQMGGHEQLSTQLVVWSSIGSVFTVFLTVCVLMATGILLI